jgi:hypothetical protein
MQFDFLRMTISTATGLIAAYMRMCGFYGWASFWRTIYVLPGHEHNQIEEIASRAADKSIERITQHVYQQVGSSVINNLI